ncbi:hypothetical protein HGO38_30490 [Rhizobium sp. CG5]|uniref:ORC-CDC6 family AAA ATPase n=1 Tax=Rhizobium sp. CG5 TaxID=2726076 RepID=UPI0020344FFC|nr:hypothetical protein [Rhizobium sp. CG5]MCM2477777.1 hypothetical protein [Rhizobium sp. CG5]
MQNPFGPNRIEYESKPILWFGKKSEQISKAETSVFVAGTRGSGKTSILRSLSTLHIHEDRNLAAQIGSLGWYGVFFQLNETFSPLIDNAVLALIPEQIRLDPQAVTNRHFVIFSHYLELKIAERLLETICILRRGEHLIYSATDEREISLDIHKEILHFLPMEGRVEFFGLNELRSLISRYVDRCVNAFFYGKEEAQSVFFATDPGAILNKIFEAISPLAVGPAFSEKQPLLFKILIDDCEVLTPLQQQFLNSIVRKTRGNIKWVLAYIGGLYDTIRTVIPGQSLSSTDRLVENLDSSSDSEFANLCQNVASLRLFYALPENLRSKLERNDPLKAFKLRERLGKLSVNQIIERVIETGHSEGRQRLIQVAEHAREFLTINVTRAQREQFSLNVKARPYVEGLALELLPSPDHKRPYSEDDAKALHAVIRRKQSWAFLEACRILRLHDYPYVGHQIIIQLSDLCIRDFLDIMGEIFERVVTDPKKMLDFVNSTSEIPMEQQRQAVSMASEKKLQGLESLSHPFEEESARMVRALGRLTARLQSEGTKGEAVTTAERGLYRINIGELRSMCAKLGYHETKVDAVLRRAEKDGFIREVSERGKLENDRNNPDSAEVTIRLHRRFAPYFKFSYRGPYEVNVLPSARLIELLFQRAYKPEDWANAVMRDLVHNQGNPSSEQPSLFDEGLE